jgi:diguanylate cyclase (GGDEF)-like protein/PAS domain S-box-containing protein
MNRMKNRDKTKNQLIHEVAELNQRIAELEKLETQHNQVEEALRESEEKYRELINGMIDTAWVIDFNGNFIDVNDAAVKIFGYSREEFLSMGPRDIDSSLDIKKIDSLIKGMPADKLQVFETTHITKNGKTIPVEIKSSLMTYQGKRAILSIARDITERKRAEQILRESEEKYRNLVERANDGIVIGQDGIIRYANPRSAYMGGYTVEELTGAPIFDFFFSEERARFIDRYRRRLAGEDVPPVYESALKHKDGSRIEVEINAGVISYNGKPADLVLFRDITERKRAEEALRESEERFRLAFENANTGVCLVDLEGNLTKVNNKMCEIFGYTKEELERMTVNGIAHSEDIEKSPSFILKTLRGEIDQGTFEKRYLHKKGHVVTCQVSSSLVRNADGSPLYFISHVQDISERKRAEEALRRSEETANRLAQENSIMAEIGRIISSTLDIEAIHEHFAEEVKKLIPFDRIAINTINFEDKTLTIAYVTGVDVTDRLKGTAIPLVGTLAGEVVRTRKSMVIQAEDPKKVTDRFPGLLVSFQAGIRSLMAIPLISKDEVVGALHFHSTKPNAYREKDLRLAEEVGNQIAGAIANAQLFIKRKRAEEALRQSEEKYRTILESIEEGYYEVDLAGNFTFFNDSMCRLSGYSKEELMGMNNRQYTDRENAKRLFQAFNQVYRTGESGRGFDYEIIRRDGTKKYIETSVSSRKDSSGNPIGFRGIVRDITERNRFEEILRQERETFFSILQKEPYGALLIDTNETFLYINPEFTAITGYTIKDVPTGREWFRKAHPDPEYRHKIIAMWKEDITSRKGVDRVWSVVCKDGEIKEIEFKLNFLDDGRIILMLSDVTERKRTEEELAYRATHDLLTGLPNRMLLKDRFSVAMAEAQRVHKKLAVIFLDLDRFKEVNDRLGHNAGDRLLYAVGNRLMELLRKTDTVARIGGDEFLLLLPNIERAEDVINISQTVLDVLREPFIVDGHEVSISASIGIAIYPDDGTDVDTLVSRADKAMYEVKQRGNDTYAHLPQTITGETSE